MCHKTNAVHVFGVRCTQVINRQLECLNIQKTLTFVTSNEKTNSYKQNSENDSGAGRRCFYAAMLSRSHAFSHSVSFSAFCAQQTVPFADCNWKPCWNCSGPHFICATTLNKLKTEQEMFWNCKQNVWLGK